MIAPLKISNIKIPVPVILAPLAGVTDYPFRCMVRRFGPCLVMSEMIASQALVRDSGRSLKMAATATKEHPLSVQISGSDPAIMAEAAKMVQDIGAAIVDINMGCPQPKIVKTNSGAALMKDELLAGRIIRAVVEAVRIPVTVKIRLGWDSKSINAPRIAKIAEESGAAMVAVHGRTRAQMFSGKADWERIRTVKEAVNIPVVANGDIVSPEDAKRCLDVSGAEGVMIGRGAMGRPWIIQHTAHYLQTGELLPDPEPALIYELALDHLHRIMDFYGSPVGVWLARRHLCYYTKGKKGGALFRKAVNQAKTAREMEELVHRFFQTLGPAL